MWEFEEAAFQPSAPPALPHPLQVAKAPPLPHCASAEGPTFPSFPLALSMTDRSPRKDRRVTPSSGKPPWGDN